MFIELRLWLPSGNWGTNVIYNNCNQGAWLSRVMIRIPVVGKIVLLPSSDWVGRDSSLMYPPHDVSTRELNMLINWYAAHGKRSGNGPLDSTIVLRAANNADDPGTNDDETMNPPLSTLRIKWLAIPRGRQILMMPLPAHRAHGFHVMLPPHSRIEEDWAPQQPEAMNFVVLASFRSVCFLALPRLLFENFIEPTIPRLAMFSLRYDTFNANGVSWQPLTLLHAPDVSATRIQTMHPRNAMKTLSSVNNNCYSCCGSPVGEIKTRSFADWQYF